MSDARSASGPELWRLNPAGLLAVVGEPKDPIDHETASQLIDALLRDRADQAAGRKPLVADREAV